LSEELADTGVTVTCLAPGRTESEFGAVAGIASVRQAGGVADARSVAEAGVRAMKQGKRMVVTGFRNRALLFAERFVSRGMVVRAVRRMQEKRRTRGT
jgi:short-subunit dehydrogenase